MRCPLCGYEFAAEQLTCHDTCPLNGSCLVVCCPHCGYALANPERSRITHWLARLFHREAADPAPATPAGSVPLLSLRPGEGGAVTTIVGDAERCAELSQYGLTPGTPVQLRQRRPVPIVAVGETELALDLPVAAAIYVAR